MDDLKEALSGFLSQPGALEQVMNMAASLGLQPDSANGKTEPDGKSPGAPAGEALPPEALEGLLKAAQEIGKPDETTALLTALRPLLRPERQAKLDRAVKLYGLLRAARAIPGLAELRL